MFVITACDQSIFLTITLQVMSHVMQKAADDILDYRPVTLFAMLYITGASLHNGCIVMHLLGNKTNLPSMGKSQIYHPLV